MDIYTTSMNWLIKKKCPKKLQHYYCVNSYSSNIFLCVQDICLIHYIYHLQFLAWGEDLREPTGDAGRTKQLSSSPASSQPHTCSTPECNYRQNTITCSAQHHCHTITLPYFEHQQHTLSSAEHLEDTIKMPHHYHQHQRQQEHWLPQCRGRQHGHGGGLGGRGLWHEVPAPQHRAFQHKTEQVLLSPCDPADVTSMRAEIEYWNMFILWPILIYQILSGYDTTM